MRIGIGIDTGGTCTDAVAVDLDTEEFLAKGKTLTTREDLSVGIGKALDMLPPEYVKQAVLVSLSTTLATNACIEGKGCRAKLVVFGLPEEYGSRMHAPENYNLTPDATLWVDTHGSADGLRIDEPDWEALFRDYGDWLKDSDALSACEIWSDDTGAPNEKRFKELAEKRTGRKCVISSELTGGVNVFARGCTALLNARLFPIVREFVDAASKDFAERGCKAPIMVVRSDGTLMSKDLTLSRPVETMLCGPAASVLAGKSFADSKNYIIIDMGGTSTDVSVVSGGEPVMSKDGISLAGWATSVKGIKVSPYNLGGDSAVRLEKKKPRLFPRRNRSVCSAACEYPQIRKDLERLIESDHYNPFPLHEFLYLLKEPDLTKQYSKQELKLIDACRKGPLMLHDLEERAGIDVYSLDSERLETEGVLLRIGLTPTDFMHIKGDYLEYDREVSVLAARYMLRSMGRPDTGSEIMLLADEVYELVEAKMYENIVSICLERSCEKEFKEGVSDQTGFLIRRAWELRNKGDKAVLLSHSFGTEYTLIGIGAPTHLFLPEVAKALGAPYLLPENAEVANAIGALKADLSARIEVHITERFSNDLGRFIYIVHAPGGSVRLETREEAIELARKKGEAAALAEAKARGAKGNVSVRSWEFQKETEARTGERVRFGLSVFAEAKVIFE